MRPTRQVAIRGDDGAVLIEDKPEWKTIERWLHLDSNPCTGKCGYEGEGSRFSYYFYFFF
jgi:hypothetical protein